MDDTMSDYAEKLDHDLAKKYRFHRKAGWAGAIAAFLAGLITALATTTYQPLLMGTTAAFLIGTIAMQLMAESVRAQTTRRIENMNRRFLP